MVSSTQVIAPSLVVGGSIFVIFGAFSYSESGSNLLTWTLVFLGFSAIIAAVVFITIFPESEQ